MKTVKTSADVVVIGAGIAGISAAAELSNSLNVIVLERESQPGYHATGRSAAYFSPAYGNAVVRGLSAASEQFYKSPPEGFAPSPLLHPRDAIHIAPPGYEHKINNAIKTISTVHNLTIAEALTTVPILSADYVAAAAVEVGGGDLDVDVILQGYARKLRGNSGRIVTNSEVVSIETLGDSFAVATPSQKFSCRFVVNAAGAWADQIAQLAGISPLGLTPRRRTAFVVPAPDGVETKGWPLVINEVDPLYFKPDAGALLISPMDETPSAACDAAPEELDIAQAAARFEASTVQQVKRITHRWAGLRTFAPDETFVLGFEPQLEGFFWLAGQGGYGVQTAPALSRLTAGLISAAAVDEQQPEWAFVNDVAPARLRT